MNRPRWLGRRFWGLLAVVFLLTAIWAGYDAYDSTHTAPATAASTPLATFEGHESNSFVASLRPNYLYNNSSEVRGGNVTLFTTITSSVDVSLVYLVTTNRSASIEINESVSVVLSTPVWAKTLATFTNRSSNPATTGLAVAASYTVNVSAVVALAAAIDAQLQYTGPAFTVSLDPELVGQVGVGGAETSFDSTPIFNLTFLGTLISPSGFGYTTTGTVTDPAPFAPPPAVPGYGVLGLLAAAVLGFGATTWLAVRRSPRRGTPPLADLLAPYGDSVVEAGPLPSGLVTIPVASFPDLVKVADTLAKPILRTRSRPSDGEELSVVDAGLVYRLRSEAESASGPAARAPLPTARPAKPSSKSVLRPPPTPPTSPQPGPRRAAPTASLALLNRLQTATTRLLGTKVGPERLTEAQRRIRRAIDLIREGNDREAALEVDALSRLLPEICPPEPNAGQRPARMRPGLHVPAPAGRSTNSGNGTEQLRE